MSPLAGSKRSRSNDPDEGLPYGDADPTPSLKEDRKEKPKDWRAAFLEEDEAEERRQKERRRERERGEDRGALRRSNGRERSRSRDRSRDAGARGGGGVGGRDRERRGDSREIDPARDRSTSHHRAHSPSGSSHRRRTRTPSPTRGGAPRSYPPRGGYSAAPSRGGGGGAGGRGDYRGGSDGYRGRGGAGGNRGGRGDYNYHPNARPYNNQYPVSDPSQRNNSNAPPPPPPPPPPAPVVVEPPKPEIIEEIPDEEELDPEEALAARRRKRQEILERFQQENQSTTTSAAGTPGPSESGGLSVAANEPISRGISPAAPSPSASFSLAKEDESSVPQDSSSSQAFQSAPNANDEVSAADYDPSADRQAEEIRRHQNETERQDATVSVPAVEVVQPKAEEVEEEEDDDDDDMFSDVVKVKKVKPIAANGALAVPVARIAPIAATSAATLSDNWDDSDGYYRITPGEVIDDGRYQIYTTLGKGMFSAVVKARVLKGSPTEPEGIDVAIKIIRSQESMYKAGLKEIQILNKLRAADPDDKKHLVRLERTFEHRGHLCMVFENLSMNLRDVIKRFGKDVGLNIQAVRAYAHQMFLALSLMQKCRIMHADIKPDNILVTENKSFLKICDLGSASDESENEITPYLVSRFYRAPEIILGLPYDCSLDIWSIGCTLFELYTGKILFPGRTNNQMLLHHMELKGKFNHRIIKKSQFGEMHFDETMNFISVEVDKITGQNTSKTLSSFKARDLKARLLPSANAQHKMKGDELKMLLGFVDLLDKCLMLDSSKRITPREALMHPFIRGG